MNYPNCEDCKYCEYAFNVIRRPVYDKCTHNQSAYSYCDLERKYDFLPCGPKGKLFQKYEGSLIEKYIKSFISDKMNYMFWVVVALTVLTLSTNGVWCSIFLIMEFFAVVYAVI